MKLRASACRQVASRALLHDLFHSTECPALLHSLCTLLLALSLPLLQSPTGSKFDIAELRKLREAFATRLPLMQGKAAAAAAAAKNQPANELSKSNFRAYAVLVYVRA